MPRSFNQHQIIGTLGTPDDELQLSYTNNTETPVITVSIATNDSVKRNGEWEEETNWHRATAWSRTAEVLVDYCRGGGVEGVPATTVFIQGPVFESEYEDKNGVTRRVREIQIRELNILRNGDFEDSGGSNRRRSGGGSAPRGGGRNQGEDDDFNLF